MKFRDFKYLIYVPSFYGAVLFNLFYFFYLLDIIKFDDGSFSVHLIFCFTGFLFIFSSIVYLKYYRDVIIKNYDDFQEKKNKYRGYNLILLLLFLLGFYGSYLYLIDTINFFGGFSNYMIILFSDSSTEIRANGESFNSSSGIQLSYFAWVASGVSVFLIRKKVLNKRWYLFVLFTFILNLLFIDRTRPIWILFVIIITIAPLVHSKLTIGRIIKYSLIIFSIIIFIFSAIAIVAGKETEKSNFRGWDLPPEILGIVNYGVSPYAYFNHIIDNEAIINVNLDRTIYPLLKVMSSLGISEEPTSLINDFYFVPTPTNVGTFLEPFYRDGGFGLLIFGIILHTFILNNLGLYFLRNQNPFGIFAYANICFIDLISFFTPKINNFPIWFFILVGFIFIILGKLKYNK